MQVPSRAFLPQERSCEVSLKSPQLPHAVLPGLLPRQRVPGQCRRRFGQSRRSRLAMGPGSRPCRSAPYRQCPASAWAGLPALGTRPPPATLAWPDRQTSPLSSGAGARFSLRTDLLPFSCWKYQAQLQQEPVQRRARRGSFLSYADTTCASSDDGADSLGPPAVPLPHVLESPPGCTDLLTVRGNLGCSGTHRDVVFGQGCNTGVVPVCCLHRPETTASRQDFLSPSTEDTSALFSRTNALWQGPAEQHGSSGKVLCLGWLPVPRHSQPEKQDLRGRGPEHQAAARRTILFPCSSAPLFSRCFSKSAMPLAFHLRINGIG